jgi:hypothetical protein
MSAPAATITRCTGRLGVIRGLGDLHAARLAAAADLDLGLDDRHAAQLLSRGTRLGRGVGGDAGEHGDPVLLEQITGLVLEEIHV